MISLLLILGAFASQDPATEAPLLTLARRVADPELLAEVRARPADARDAIEEAFAAAVARPGDAAAALQLADRVARAYHLAWDDSLLVRGVARFRGWSEGQRRARVEADSLMKRGNAAYGTDGPAAAMAHWRAALGLWEALGDTAGMAAAWGNLGVGHQRGDRTDSATASLERARRLAAAAGDRRVEANALGHLGWSRFEAGDYEGARSLYDGALRLRESIGDDRGLAADRNDLGLVARELGDLEAARMHFEAALALNRAAGRETGAATNLTNLAGLAALAAEPGRAASLYHEALRSFRAEGLDLDAADVLREIGALAMRHGDYAGALESLTEALVVYDAAGLAGDAIDVRRDIAGAAAAMGDLARAHAELRAAQEAADSADVGPAVHAGIALGQGDLAVVMNRLAEAESSYGLAAELYGEVGDARGVAEARQGLGVLLLEAEDFTAAERTLTTARQAQAAAGDLRAAGLSLLWIATARAERGDTAAARALLRQGIAEVHRAGDVVAEAALTGELARLEAGSGLPVLADSLFAAALELLDGRVAPDVRWWILAGRGMAARTAGGRDAAAGWLRAAQAEIERVSAGLALPERRSAYRADKWEVYAQLALTEWARGRTAAAFEASERMRARETAALMERAETAPAHSLPADLARRERELRRRISELARSLEGTLPRPVLLRGWDPGEGGAPVREALARAQAEYALLLLESRERTAEPTPDLAVRTWREVASRLPRDAALIEYLASDSGVVAFVVTRDSLAGFQVPAERRELARLVEFARGTLTDSRGAAVGRWQAPLRRLYELLIAPAITQKLIPEGADLVVVPHGELHYLPFAALIDREGRFLVERFTLSHAPSASLWVTLGERATPPSERGLLALAPRVAELPATRREVLGAARGGGPGSRSVIGPAATETLFRREAPRYRTLHLATFGVLNKHNPLFSFVELGTGGGHDGRLEVHEVLGLRLAADLVILSACQTALGSGTLADVPPGDDWVGFTRAFLQAGAAGVLATLWSVADAPTATLLEGFHSALEMGDTPARALARAQRRMLREPGATPFDWAGATLVTTAPRAR